MPDTGLNIVTGACRTGGEYKLQPVFAEDLAELAVNAAQSLSTGNQPVFQGSASRWLRRSCCRMPPAGG